MGVHTKGCFASKAAAHLAAMSGSSDRNTHYCLASHTFTHISKHCTASDLSWPCNQQYLAHVTWPGCQWRGTVFRENCRQSVRGNFIHNNVFILTRQSHDICDSWWNYSNGEFYLIFGKFSPLVDPSKKNPMRIIHRKDVCEKNSRILPDFEGKEIMQSPYLNNKFQQAQRKQESFIKKSFFPLWPVSDKFG